MIEKHAFNRVAVILAGGNGSRFWPLSRKNKPKQFLKILGSESMLNMTIQRFQSLIDLEHTFIVANQKHRETLEGLLPQALPLQNILYESCQRNTAAAILYSALAIADKYGKETVAAVIPSDHSIADTQVFCKVLQQALEVAQTSRQIVLIGLKPSYPATGFGYLQYHPESTAYGDTVHRVLGFVEKPEQQRAQRYIEAGDYLWNAGMFMYRVDVMLENFKCHLPAMYQTCMQIWEMEEPHNRLNKIQDVYALLEDISIDYGILEKSKDLLVIPADFGWNDVGSWDALDSMHPKDAHGNVIIGNHVGIETSGSIFLGDAHHLIATMGVQDLVIVQHENVILVCAKNKAQDVKKMMQLLKEKGLEHFA